MEFIITALVEAIPVGGGIREVNDEFCYLVQNGRRGHRHDARYWAQLAQPFGEVQ